MPLEQTAQRNSGPAGGVEAPAGIGRLRFIVPGRIDRR